jgi:hypothetical protein
VPDAGWGAGGRLKCRTPAEAARAADAPARLVRLMWPPVNRRFVMPTSGRLLDAAGPDIPGQH